MKIVYLGARGMLGRDFLDAARGRGVEAAGLDLPEVDITDPESLQRRIPECDAVINGAAFTRVDDAEKEEEAARRINAHGAGRVAALCAARGIPLLHISTDYVFNGRKGEAYVEADPVEPLSVYGLTKREGEVAVMAAGGRTLVVRTQSLYGIHGRNFVKAIMNQLLQGKKTLTVVEDQVSSPTYTRHLAAALLDLAGAGHDGVVHVAARGSCSWHRFAAEIVAQLGLPGVEVKPMASAQLNYPAPRPAFSVLSSERYTSWTGKQMPTWEEGLRAYLDEDELAAALRRRSV